jgi:hypothetical protein
MKKVITVVLISICYLAISFTAQAQKSKFAKPAATAAVQAQLPNVRDVAIVAAMNPQNPKLTQITGIIKNETNYAFDFAYSADKYFLTLNECNYEKRVSGTGDIQMITEGYFYANVMNIKQTDIVYEKINEKEYRYTVYNVPLKINFAIAFSFKSSDIGCKGCVIDFDKDLKNVAIDNAYKQTGLANIVIKNPYVSSYPGTIITQNITIKNAQVQVVN